MTRPTLAEQRLRLAIALEHDGIDIERIDDDVVVAAEKAWADQCAAVTLEAFLLVRSWACPSRSGARNMAPASRNRCAWITSSASGRWAAYGHALAPHLAGTPTVAPGQPVTSANSFSPARQRSGLDVALRDHHAVTMVLNGEPLVSVSSAVDEFRAALRSGLPVLLWCPGAMSEELHDLVTWLAKRGDDLLDVPDRSKTSRRAALGSSVHQLEGNHARDLAVLWDDPERAVDVGRPAY